MWLFCIFLTIILFIQCFMIAGLFDLIDQLYERNEYLEEKYNQDILKRRKKYDDDEFWRYFEKFLLIHKALIRTSGNDGQYYKNNNIEYKRW